MLLNFALENVSLIGALTTLVVMIITFLYIYIPKQSDIPQPLISPTEILIDDIKRIRSQASSVDHSSFYRLVEKLDIDWEKVLSCCLDSRNEDMLCYLIDTSFYHENLKQNIVKCINSLVIKAFCWRSGQVLKLLLENFGYVNELRQVDNIILNENLLAGAQYIISMFNRDGRHKYRNKPFTNSESRADFEMFYKQVSEIKQPNANLGIYFSVETNKRISNPLSYCLLVTAKMTDSQIVGEKFAKTIGADYFDLLVTLCDHCWSTNDVTIDMAAISNLFKNETHRNRITEALNGKIKSNNTIPELYLLSKQSILNTVTDIRRIEQMDSLPEHIREIILLPKSEIRSK